MPGPVPGYVCPLTLMTCHGKCGPVGPVLLGCSGASALWIRWECLERWDSPRNLDSGSLRRSTCKSPWILYSICMQLSIIYIYVIYICIYIYEDPRYLTAYYISISSGSQEAAALAPARSTYPTYPLLRQRCKSACEEARNDSAAFDVFSGKIGKSPNSHSEVLRFGASNWIRSVAIL